MAGRSPSPQWLAGFFDGEGCVNVTLVGKSRRPSLRVYLVNTDAAVLGLIASAYGGRLATPKRLKEGWKPFRSLAFTGKAASGFLRIIRPYVLLKRAQVELGIALWDQMHKPRGQRMQGVRRPSGGGMSVVRTDVAQREMEGKAIMGLLNRKGA